MKFWHRFLRKDEVAELDGKEQRMQEIVEARNQSEELENRTKILQTQISLLSRGPMGRGKRINLRDG